MSPRALSEQPFELGGWRVEPARGVLSPLAGGEEAHLEPRLMDLLLLFAGSAGRVLGFTILWPHDQVRHGMGLADPWFAPALAAIVVCTPLAILALGRLRRASQALRSSRPAAFGGLSIAA